VTQTHPTIPTLEGAPSKLCLGGDFDFDRIAQDVARSEIDSLDSSQCERSQP